MTKLPAKVSDGNGGELDTRTAPARDLITALHVKVDDILIPTVRRNEARIEKLEEKVAKILGAVAALAFILTALAAIIAKVHP